MKLFGYEFRNARLAEEALTTPSYRMQFPDAADNQRLEFLGDAVLGLLASERLYAEFSAEREGRLTVRRTHMVSTAALCRAAARHDLAPLLRRNHGCAPLPENSKTLADAIEAVIGAAFLDGGLDAARAVFDALALESAAESETEWSENPKGELQVRTQAMVPPRRPEYTLVNITGKAHAPTFTVRVSVDGLGEATASAASRRAAESAAAAMLLSEYKQEQGVERCGS